MKQILAMIKSYEIACEFWLMTKSLVSADWDLNSIFSLARDSGPHWHKKVCQQSKLTSYLVHSFNIKIQNSLAKILDGTHGTKQIKKL